GTVGAALAMVIVFALMPAGWVAQLGAALIVSALSVWSSQQFADEGDPGWIVIDEAAGAMVATIGLGVLPAFVAFAIFRIADITKRFPGVAYAERFPGGWGITADDLVAGGWALAAGWLLQSLI
ncbi:MAG TPA: phosphatidylglycerophosphatase A, partial [Actinobacteria bacterium]|nr:phosphatidylglycerophosphatase A [Actinomycetota bacterium]